MPTVAEAAKVVSVETGEPESFVSQISRSLINSEVLPKNVGKRLSQVEEQHVTMLLLATYTATKFADAAERAMRYSRLKQDGEDGRLTFGTFLTRALKDLQIRHDASIRVNDKVLVPYGDLRIEIVTSYPMAIISAAPHFGNPPFHGFINFAETPHTAKYWPSNKPRRSVTIPGYVLFEMVNRLFELPDPPPDLVTPPFRSSGR
jgi:hypothetical protein